VESVSENGLFLKCCR